MTRRLALAIGLVILAITLGLTSWPAPRSWIDRTQQGSLAGLPGIRVALDDAPRFRLLPEPRLEIGRLRAFDSDGRELLEISRLSGALKILPLVAGRFEFADATVIGPRMSVDAAPSLDRVVDSAVEALAVGADDKTPFGGLDRLVVINGATTHPEDGLSRMNVVIRHSHRRNAFDAVGSLNWRSESVDVELAGLKPNAILRGETSPLLFHVKGRLGGLRFNGAIQGGGAPQADGSLEVSSTALPALGRWLGLSFPLPVGGRLLAQGAARVIGGNLALSDARLEVDAGVLDGVLTVGLANDKVSLAGTLAADVLNLTSALEPVLPVRRADGAWSQDTIDIGALPGGTTDLRLSAGRLDLGRISIANAALSILSRPGRTDVSLGSGDLFGGRIKGRATIAAAEGSGVDMKAQGSAERIDAARAVLALTGGDRLNGVASGSFVLEGSGETTAGVMRSLEGKAALAIRQGEFSGVNLPEILRRIEKRPLIAAIDVRGGKTPFDVATISGRVAKGVFEVAEGVMTSPAMRLVLTGQVGLGDRAFQLAGQAQAQPQSATGRDGAMLPFEVTGTFDDPVIAPDAKSIIRRSGAAAPLYGGRNAATMSYGARDSAPADVNYP